MNDTAGTHGRLAASRSGTGRRPRELPPAVKCSCPMQCAIAGVGGGAHCAVVASAATLGVPVAVRRRSISVSPRADRDVTIFRSDDRVVAVLAIASAGATTS